MTVRRKGPVVVEGEAMKHTPTREILEAAARQQHEDGRVWCEATRQYEGMGIIPEVSKAINVCYGCQQPLAHSNHRWSRKRMAVAWIASQKEASDHERPDYRHASPMGRAHGGS